MTGCALYTALKPLSLTNITNPCVMHLVKNTQTCTRWPVPVQELALHNQSQTAGKLVLFFFFFLLGMKCRWKNKLSGNSSWSLVKPCAKVAWRSLSAGDKGSCLALCLQEPCSAVKWPRFSLAVRCHAFLAGEACSAWIPSGSSCIQEEDEDLWLCLETVTLHVRDGAWW